MTDIEIEKNIIDACMKTFLNDWWMDENDMKIVLNTCVPGGMEKLISNVKIGIQNGHSIEKQMSLLILVLNSINV